MCVWIRRRGIYHIFGFQGYPGTYPGDHYKATGAISPFRTMAKYMLACPLPGQSALPPDRLGSDLTLLAVLSRYRMGDDVLQGLRGYYE